MIFPARTTRIMSALRMVESRWAMRKLVRPVSRVEMASWMRASVLVSMEAVASSSTKMRGLASTARAKEISCFSPVESWPPPSPTSLS